MDYACPNCGAPLTFKSSVSIYTTCTHCRSMVVRHDMDLERLGEVSELLNDNSPFQVGTVGTFQNKGFMLLGRIKLVYDGGTWSEWYAQFDDGREGWLAEAQGQYMMSFEAFGGEVMLPPPGDIRVNAQVSLGGQMFEVDDIQQVTYAGSEGELPFVFQPGYRAVSVDLRTKEGLFGSILYGPDEPQLFVGRYAEFDEFKFDFLRELDGWQRH